MQAGLCVLFLQAKSIAMKNLIFVLCTFTPFLLSAQSEIRTVDAFTGVSTSSLVSIELKPGSPCGVEIIGDAEATKTITTEVKDGTLVIGQDGHAKGGPVKLIITVSDLKKVDIDGAASVKGSSAFTTDSIHIHGEGGSQIQLTVAANVVDVDLGGAAELRVCGTTNRYHVKVGGAAKLHSGCLDAKRVDVDAKDAAQVSVMATESVEAKSRGAANVLIYGDATDRSVETQGAGSIDTRSGSGAADTTRLEIGGRHVDISHDPDERSDREKKSSDDDFEFWSGFDLGINGLLTYDNKITMPQGLESMELNYVRSYMFGWNMWQKNIHIYRNNVNLGTGIGMTWYHYSLRNSYTLQPNVPYTFAVYDSLNYKKNQLNTAYVNVPLFLEFNTNTSKSDKSFHIGGGAEFGYNIFKNKVKQKYELDGKTYKRKVKDDYNVNPFKVDLIARIGYGSFSIFGSYSITTLFEKDKGPALYPFTAGVHYDF